MKISDEATLWVVSTPIGNLQDMAPRAIEILQQVGFVACEDTRYSKKLMSHFNIQTDLLSLHEHNEEARCEAIVDRLLSVQPPHAALVTDAGTPGISDPGARLVAACHRRGVKVLVVPGPSALVAALSASGFLEPRQLFVGFLPRSSRDRREAFALWERIAPLVVVFFESPMRIQGALKDLQEKWGDDLMVAMSREMTKIYEENLVAPIGQVISSLNERDQVRGEFVVCVHLQKCQGEQQAMVAVDIDELAKALVAELKDEDGGKMKGSGGRLRALVKDKARAAGVSSKDLYAGVVRIKKSE